VTVAEALDRLDAALAEVGECRGHPVILCHGRIDDHLVRLVHDAVHTLGSGPIDVVLTSNGGTATAALRLATLLHESTGALGVLVPRRARSAGTMVCLGADELVLTDIAELGPLDPIMQQTAGPAGSAAISAADVRAFRRMAVDWFDVPAGDGGVEVLVALAAQVFPVSLAQLHRFDALARGIADRLLRRHLPAADSAQRAEIVTRLVEGYHSHDYPIMRAEAREIGLRVASAPVPLARALSRVADATDAVLAEAPGEVTNLARSVPASSARPAHHRAEPAPPPPLPHRTEVPT
jgi:hypothetical protein